MVRAEAKFAWHLKRGQKIYGAISHRELRLLAELGHLRPDDSLWRPGLGSWISPSSVPGVPPLVAPRDSQTKQWDLTRIRALFLTASAQFHKLALSNRQHSRSVKAGLQRAYDRVASRWPNLDLIVVVRQRPHQGHCGRLTVDRSLYRNTGLRYESFLRNRQQGSPNSKLGCSKIPGSSIHRTCCSNASLD